MICIYFSYIILQKILGGIAYNVSAVYDVFAVAIKERVRSSNRKNVAEFWRGNVPQRSWGRSGMT
jgi:hypothetical protein